MDNCLICNKNDAVYKCPKCRIKYCSANCYKEHQKNPCIVKNECHIIEEPTISTSTHTTEATITEDKLKLLESNEELQNILKNKHVRDILQEIDGSADAAGIMDRAMKEPIFIEFADACLKLMQK